MYHKWRRGEATLHPRVTARVMQELRGEREERGASPFTLTEREIEVLRLVAVPRAWSSIRTARSSFSQGICTIGQACLLFLVHGVTAHQAPRALVPDPVAGYGS
ncbi:MAG: response regulator transcription factor [bacterium]|nr:response regulator transcription factor [bacterium]